MANFNGKFSFRSKKPNKTRKAQPKPPASPKTNKAQIYHRNGFVAEQIVASLFPKWKHMNRTGYDFWTTMHTRGKMSILRRIEVKSTASKEKDKAKLTIVLKASNRQWANQKANDLVILTREMIYFGKANDVRDHVAKNYHHFTKVTFDGKGENISVPIQEMVKLGIIVGMPRRGANQEQLERLWMEKCFEKPAEPTRPVGPIGARRRLEPPLKVKGQVGVRASHVRFPVRQPTKKK